MASPDEKCIGMPIKYLSFGGLIFQNVAVTLLMRYTRSNAAEKLFLPSTAVISAEFLKLCICVVAVQTEGSLSVIFENKVELLKTSVPALLYLIQNNLIYYAMGKLDAATFSVVYQSKVLITALLSVLILGRKLSSQQWFSLLLLMFGIICVQLSAQGGSTADEDIEFKERLLGLLGVMAGALCTSLAGIYFELILKKGTLSLYARNVQLAGYSAAIGLVGIMMTEDRIGERLILAFSLSF
jgi:UDP-sugar transporter A1/2/3